MLALEHGDGSACATRPPGAAEWLLYQRMGDDDAKVSPRDASCGEPQTKAAGGGCIVAGALLPSTSAATPALAPGRLTRRRLRPRLPPPPPQAAKTRRRLAELRGALGLMDALHSGEKPLQRPAGSPGGQCRRLGSSLHVSQGLRASGLVRTRACVHHRCQATLTDVLLPRCAGECPPGVELSHGLDPASFLRGRVDLRCVAALGHRRAGDMTWHPGQRLCGLDGNSAEHALLMPGC